MNSAAEQNPAYLLTIGIPTYSRAHLLDLCLASVLPQVQALSGLVECIVTDDASTDHTASILEKYRDQYDCLKLFYNEKNLGIIGNITKTASELANGKYILMIGDDDVLTEGAVARIVNALRTDPEPEILALNVGYLPRSLKPKPEDGLGGVRVHCEKTLRSFATRELTSLSDALEGPPADFTASYSVVIKRESWRRVFPRSCSEPLFSTLKTSYPSGFVVAETVRDKRVTVLGEPSVIIYEMPGNEFSWAKYRGVASTRFVMELIRKFEAAGVPASQMLPYKKYQLQHRNQELGELIWDKNTAGGWRDAFHFAWMLKRYPIRLLRCFVLSLLHKDAPKWLSWIPRMFLSAKQSQ